MRVRLLLNGADLDLFEDESIVLVNQLRSFDDFERVVGDYTFSFNVPATRVNNKLFNHFYDVDILGGFNPHVGAEAQILIHNLKEVIGKLELKGVKVENREPKYYKVVFYGTAVSLASKFGDDLLTDIDLSAFDHDTNFSNVNASWNGTLLGGKVFYPIIDYKGDFLYTNNPKSGSTGSRYINEAGGNPIAVRDLRPAYKLRSLLTEIFANYGLSLSGDFITDAVQSNLFVLPMQDSGLPKNWEVNNDYKVRFSCDDIDMSIPVGTAQSDVDINSVDFDPLGLVNISPTDTFVAPEHGVYSFRFYGDHNNAVDPESGAVLYLFVDGVQVAQDYFGVGGVLSTWESRLSYRLKPGDEVTWKVARALSVNTGYLLNNIKGEVTNVRISSVVSSKFAYNAPQKKVKEFVSDVISTFNLVLLRDTELDFRLEYFDTWIEQGNTLYWDEYIDISSVEHEKKDLPKSITLKYKKSEDAATLELERTLPQPFGAVVHYPVGDFKGAEMKMESAFNILPRTYIRDINDAFTDIPIPIMIDAEGSPTKNDFTLFYSVGFVNIQNIYYVFNASGVATAVTQHPAISVINTLSTTGQSLAFSPTYDTPLDGSTPQAAFKTAFLSYWQNTVENFYGSKTRIVKVKAMLPIGVYLTLNENDTINFYGKYYKIKDISYDLTKEEAQISLITFDPEKLPRIISIDEAGVVTADLPTGRFSALFNSQRDPVSGDLVVRRLDNTFPDGTAAIRSSKQIVEDVTSKGVVLAFSDTKLQTNVPIYPTTKSVTGWDIVYRYDKSLFNIVDQTDWEIECLFTGWLTIDISFEMQEIVQGTQQDVFLVIKRNGALTKKIIRADAKDTHEIALSGSVYVQDTDIITVEIGMETDIRTFLIANGLINIWTNLQQQVFEQTPTQAGIAL